MRKIKQVVGWREWVQFPELEITQIKAKVDTGARTSSLHAVNIEPFKRRGVAMVRFDVHPDQRSSKREVHCEAPLVEHRGVRPSTGKAEVRPVIQTSIQVLGTEYPIEVTLTNRDVMGFRLLLGRQALRGRFVVDPSASFQGGRPPRKTRRKPRRKDAS